MSKIRSYEMKGVIVWFRLIKLVYNLKLKIFNHCFVIFESLEDFVLLHLANSKPQKLLQLVLK
jgi:hypothetical protein